MRSPTSDGAQNQPQDTAKTGPSGTGTTIRSPDFMDATTIVSVAALPLCLPLCEPFAIAGGAPAMAENVLVKVVLGDGTIGLGEAAPFQAVSGETQASALTALRACVPGLVGRDVRHLQQLARHAQDMAEEEPAARSGLEQALLDAFLRQKGVPMWYFFGGHGTRLETDITITAGNTAHAQAASRSARARGFSTLKVKVGAQGAREDAERVTALFAAANEAGYPPPQIVLDANGGYSAEAALLLLRKLAAAQVPVALFEQPVARADRQGLVDVTRKGGVPICADESARTIADVRWIIEAKAAHAVNLKLCKSALFQTLAMYQAARTAGLKLMIGGMVEGPLAMGVSAHLAAGLGQFDFVDLDTPLFVTEHPFVSEIRQTNAHIELQGVRGGHGVSLATGSVISQTMGS